MKGGVTAPICMATRQRKSTELTMTHTHPISIAFSAVYGGQTHYGPLNIGIFDLGYLVHLHGRGFALQNQTNGRE